MWPSWALVLLWLLWSLQRPPKASKNNFRARSVLVLRMEAKEGHTNTGLGAMEGCQALDFLGPHTVWHGYCHMCGWDVHRPASAHRESLPVSQGRSSRRGTPAGLCCSKGERRTKPLRPPV
jgi:hypothetical protein